MGFYESVADMLATLMRCEGIDVSKVTEWFETKTIPGEPSGCDCCPDSCCALGTSVTYFDSAGILHEHDFPSPLSELFERQDV